MLQNTAIRLNSAEKGQQRSADETEKRDEEVNDMLDTIELYYFSPTGGDQEGGNYPYKEAMKRPAAPVSLPDCTRCGTCEKICPTDAIRVKDGAVTTDAEKCILCMACTAACPQKVRILPPPLQEKMEQKLGALKAVRRENEFFL